jgi:hypothetical protein
MLHSIVALRCLPSRIRASRRRTRSPARLTSPCPPRSAYLMVLRTRASSCLRKASILSNISPICSKMLSMASRSSAAAIRPSSISAAMLEAVYSSARTCMVSGV